MDLKINNIFQTNNIHKINFKTATNPINFKGLNQDTFEKQSAAELTIAQGLDLIFKKDQEIETAKAQKEELETEKEELEKEQKEIEKERKEFKKEEQKHYYKRDEYEQNSYIIERLTDLIYEKGCDLRGLKKERERLIGEINPNVEFMTDVNLNWPQRRRIARQHPEIMFLANFEKALNDTCFTKLMHDSPYFVVNRTNIGNFIDTSYEPNKENFEIVSKEGMLSYSQFCDKYGFEIQDLNRYVKEGLLTPIQLTNLKTGQKENVHVLDANDEEHTGEGIARHEALEKFLPEESRYADKNFVSEFYLSQLGYGTQKELFEAVQHKNLPGQIIPVKEGDKEELRAFVLYKHISAKGKLAYMRNQNKNITGTEEFAKIAKVDMTDLEDAILSGEVQNIREYIDGNDKNKFIFNLKNPKNIRYIHKKQFEYEILRRELKRQSSEKKSLSALIAWKLCPETKKEAKSIVAMHPELKEIFEKKQQIKEFEKRKSKGEVDPSETAPYLTRQERIKLKMFYKQMWSQAGTQEYCDARERAKIAIKEYKEGGFNNVKDEYIRQIIVDFYNKKSDNNTQEQT